MANIHSLPYEIQRLIFQNVATTKQLGECRLVCKSWNEPAEYAMFSRRLHVTDSNTKSMYMHLVEKPHRAYLIKEIHLDCVCISEDTDQLLRLAITPNLERILPDIYNQHMRHMRYELSVFLISIVKESKMELHHLKRIPLSSSFNNNTNYEAVMLFKGSLEAIMIPPSSPNYYYAHPISTHLQEFKCLTTLHVKCAFQHIPHAESVFGDAPHLKEIDLNRCYLFEPWTNEQSLDWMKQHVEINPNAITLKSIDERNSSASLLTYFLYKYPNIRRFDYDASHYRGAPNTDLVETNESICSRISQVPNYTLTSMRPHVAWRDHHSMFAGQRNTFQLYYGKTERHPYDTTINQISSKTEGQERSTQFQLWINLMPNEQFLTSLTNFFNQISEFAATSMAINFDSLHCLGSSNLRKPESKALFQALQLMNHLENFKFVSSGNLGSVDLVDLSAQHEDRRLNTLEISGVEEVQPAVFLNLDRVFNVIDELKLSFLYIKKDSSNTTCLHLPSTLVQKICLTSQMEPDTRQRDRLHLWDKIKLSQDTYIMINLQDAVTLYFKLTPSCSIVHQVSFADYFSRPTSANAFSIYCKLLASLQLDLGEIAATIDIQKYCTSLDIAFDDLRV